MAVGLMTEDGNVYDGAHTGVNCTDVFKAQFSYNAAIFLQGAAFMYSFVSCRNSSPLTRGWLYILEPTADRLIEK